MKPMTAIRRFATREGAYTAARERDPDRRPKRRGSIFVDKLLNDEFVFDPIPLQAHKAAGLKNPPEEIVVDIKPQTERAMRRALAAGALPPAVVPEVLAETKLEGNAKKHLNLKAAKILHSEDVLAVEAELNQLGLCAVRVARAVTEVLLRAASPFCRFHIRITDRAKLALALGWEAIARTGKYPLPPYGLKRLQVVDEVPAGAFHFVSASDSDAGYHYVLGIALSPEAQALRTTNVSYGLDGELIVPGQAVSPIPPLLSLATRLFASGIMTSSNISEEQHSIPIRSFPQPDNYTDFEPIRPGLNPYKSAEGKLETAVPAIVTQLQRNQGRYEVDGVIDISGLAPERAKAFARAVLESPEIKRAHEQSNSCEAQAKGRSLTERLALFYNLGRALGVEERKTAVRQAIDLAADLRLRHLAVIDDVEDSWLPGIHEYFDAGMMNELMQYADGKGVMVIDGRPVDPMYTASTALQRIQSVMTTLSVDILKAGMWLTLDAKTAEAVWLQLQENPAIARGMCLMPIGILEPWSAFVDNREPSKNARAILDPFEKVKFMIEEAGRLGMASLLTDTRHKHRWVLLGAKSGDFPKHPREGPGVDSLLSWKEFMECERLARKANLLLGQAGSIEVSQIFRIISETTYDAAMEGANPATAFWTAETERVLRSEHVPEAQGDLQAQRSAPVDPYLAVVNRIYESHAKVDGWLRFLITSRKGHAAKTSSLTRVQEQLLESKRKAEDAQDDLLRLLNGTKNTKELQAAWDACRNAYTAYHKAVRQQFAKVRAAVAGEWKTFATPGKQRGIAKAVRRT
jgi:hypothetical protein